MSDFHCSLTPDTPDKHLQKETTSIIQRLDPRARICGAIFLAFVAVCSRHLLISLMLLFLAILLVFIAKMSMQSTLKRLAVLTTFMLYLILFLPFIVPGDTLISVAGVSASWQGLWRAIDISLTANTVVLILFALVSGLSSSELGSSLQWFNVSPKLIQLLQFTLRYLSVIQEEFMRLRRSMRARAFVMRFNWHTWRTMAYLIGMMLVRSMNRSQRIVNAMKCRGYNGVFICYHVLHWKRSDTLFVLLVFSISVIMLCLNLIL